MVPYRDLIYIGIILVLVLIIIYLMARTQRSREMLDRLEKNEALISVRLSSENITGRDVVDVAHNVIESCPWKFDKPAAEVPAKIFSCLVKGKKISGGKAKAISAFLTSTAIAKLLDASGEDGATVMLKKSMRYLTILFDDVRLEIYNNDSFAYQMKFLIVVQELNKSDVVEPLKYAVLMAWLCHGDVSDSQHVDSLAEELEDMSSLRNMTESEKNTSWDDVKIYLTRLDYSADITPIQEAVEVYNNSFEEL